MPNIALWHNPTMLAKPVQISFDTSLLDQIDAVEEPRVRSAFVRPAIEFYLPAKRRRQQVEEDIAHAYSEQPDAPLTERR